MITIDEDYYEQIKDELSPLTFGGLCQDEDGNLVSVEPKDSKMNSADKKKYKTPAQQEKPDLTSPGYWYYVYDPRYCGGSREDYCERMAAQYRDEENKEKLRKIVEKSKIAREEERKRAKEREQRAKGIEASKLNAPLWAKKIFLNVYLWIFR